MAQPGEPTVEQLLGRTNELLTVIAKSYLAQALRIELKDEKMRQLYEMTGSTVSSKDIAKQLKLGLTTISNAWQRWEELGLIVKDGTRYRRVFG